MDDVTKTQLAEAARTYREAPEHLKAAILAAADKGDKPAEITRAIEYTYTADYVARLVREHRKAKGGGDA